MTDSRKLAEMFADKVVEEAMVVMAASTLAEEDAAMTPDMLEMARVGAYFGVGIVLIRMREHGCLNESKFVAMLLEGQP